jgi:hypothetical protein
MAPPVRLLIATTEGPLAVERLAESPLKKSSVYVFGAREPIKLLSAGYEVFVRRRVARLPGQEGRRFRLDLSGAIEAGESWQLGAFLAHALHAAGRLAMRGEAPGAIVVATGALTHELAAGEVGNVEDKFRVLLADAALLAAMRDGVRVVVALPDANRDDARVYQSRLAELGAEIHCVSGVGRLLEALGLRRDLQAAAEADVWEGSPFRGLDVFDVQHRRIFCGRGRAREEALQSLRRHSAAGCGFLLIHGSSGVGKSSLVRAGMLGDILQASTAEESWVWAVVTPSRGDASALAGLAAALAGAVPGLAADALGREMMVAPAAAAAGVGVALRGQTGGARRLVVVVDQLEELLFWARELQSDEVKAERDAFADMLAALACDRAVWVIATLRSDLLSLLEDSPALTELARNDRLYRLERPRRGALREIIVRPAELARLRYVGQDPDELPLVDVLTEAAFGQHDCLPLLQFTLQRLYQLDQGKSGEITYTQYRQIGGLENAVGAWADTTIARLGMDEEIVRAVDDVILNLGRYDAEADAMVASPMLLGERLASPAHERVIAALDQARLIVLDGQQGAPGRTARVAHAALLTHWPRAAGVLKAHLATLALRDDLERQAVRWEAADRDRDFSLRAGRPLEEAEALVKEGRILLSKLAQDLIEESGRSVRQESENFQARFARDEREALGLLAANKFDEAAGRFEAMLGYLPEHGEDARAARQRVQDRFARSQKLAAFSGGAAQVFSLAGEENFAAALAQCRAALDPLGMFASETWFEALPVEDLSAAQAAELRQDVYRTLLLFSALNLVPAILALQGPAGGPGWARRMRAARLAARLTPKGLLKWLMINRLVPMPGMPGPARLAAARAEIVRGLGVVDEMRRVEEARARGEEPAEQASRTGLLVERMLAMLLVFVEADDKYGVIRDWLAAKAVPHVPEPADAADYFFIGLLNYFVAKRAADALAASVIFLLRHHFPDLHAAAPLQNAERLLRNAVALEAQKFWPHWLLGRTLLAAGDAKGAELSFNAAIALRPDYARGYEQRAMALGEQWRRDGDARLRARALADLQMARRCAKGDPASFWTRGEILDLLEAPFEALDAYCLWLEREVSLAATLARGSGVTQLRRRAARLLAEAHDGKRRADAQALLALLCWIEGDASGLQRAAHAALAIDPSHRHALVAIGAGMAERDPRLALTYLERGRALYPFEFRILRDRACALARLGDAGAPAAWAALLEMAERCADDAAPMWIVEEAKLKLLEKK